MGQTRLVQRLGELPIRSPAIPHQHAVKVDAEHRRGIVETPARPNGVHRGVGRGEDPEPRGLRADAPPGFIGRDDRTAAHLRTQRLVGGRGAPGRPMQELRKAARGDGEPELGAEHRGSLRERHAELRVHQHDERDGARAQVHLRGAQRVGRLPRMTTLHPAPTLDAGADLHVELPHDRLHHGQIFLDLDRDAGAGDGPATVRAAGRQRRAVAFIDVRRSGASSATALGRPGPPPRASVPALGSRLPKRRRLTEARPPRRVQLVLQPLVLPLQAIAFALDLAPLGLGTRQRLLQPRNLSALLLEQALHVVGTGRALSGHAGVMPYA